MSDLWDRIPFDPKERLSVTLMRDHVLGGHEGRYEAYCYRCQFFEERRERAKWELAAIERPRIWLSDWPRWSRMVSLGGDEFCRRTLCVGPVVIALWRFVDRDTAEYVVQLRNWAQGDEGQEDRDKQPKPAPVSSGEAYDPVAASKASAWAPGTRVSWDPA